jgi:hypothetical protein
MDKHNEWRKSLTSSEESAISSWKGSASTIRKEVTSGTLSAESQAFMDAITKSPPHTGVVYRGISGEYASAIGKQIEEAGVGGTWSDPAPHCMSRNSATGFKFSYGETLLRVVTKTGRPIQISDGYHHEMEITGMPKTVYEIAGVHKDVTVVDNDGKSKHHKYVIDLVEK